MLAQITLKWIFPTLPKIPSVDFFVFTWMSGFCNGVDVPWVGCTQGSPPRLFAFLCVKGPNVDLRRLVI